MLKKIKSLFIIEEEETTDSKQAATKGQKAASSERTQAKGAATSAGHGKITSKFLDVLLTAMDKNNLEGFDYLEYKQSLKSLSKMPMDEQTRYQSAYAMAQTMGTTPQNLMTTAEHYLKILKDEEKKFGDALSKQRVLQIGDKEKQIKQVETTIKEKASQIKKLTEEIQANQNKITKWKQDISKSVVKLETTKNNFVASYQSVVSQIQKDIENMKKYLK